MLDMVGQRVYRADIVALPSRSTRDELELRYGIVSGLGDDTAMVRTLDLRMVAVRPKNIVVLDHLSVPDDIRTSLHDLLEMV